jgi:hypothetical protein
MSKPEKWEPCPRCGSNKVEVKGGALVYFIIGFALFGISIWLLIIPIVGVTGIITGLLIMALGPFMGKFLQCQDCKKSWRFPASKNVKAAS